MSGHTDSPGVRRAWGWVDHLCAGGTTPWAQWSGDGSARATYLPGAQQLELLRRLNAAGRVPAARAGQVLEASAPGRGRPDLELVGAWASRSFGPAPVDPAALPDEELLRVAVGLVADDVVAAGLPAPTPDRRVPPWRHRYRLVGDPWLSGMQHHHLLEGDRPRFTRRPTVLVLGTDVGQMLVHAWTARSLAKSTVSWSEWLARAAGSANRPVRIDLVRIAGLWAERVGPQQVRVVLDPAAVPDLIGARRDAASPAPALGADAIDLARRVGRVLGLLVEADQRRLLLRRTLVPRLASAAGPALVLPAEHLDWARARAVRMRAGLLRAGYPVHGDPDSLLPVDRPGAAEPSDAGALALALRLLVERGGS